MLSALAEEVEKGKRRRILVTEREDGKRGCGKVTNEENSQLYSSSDISRMTKLRKISWVGYKWHVSRSWM
jgi:hypothetical protein